MEQNFDITSLDLVNVIMNTIQKRKRRIYLDITNKCQHVTERAKDECTTDKRN